MKQIPDDGTRAWYNRIAQIYDILAWRDEKTLVEAGLRLLDIQKGERVLEIGF